MASACGYVSRCAIVFVIRSHSKRIKKGEKRFSRIDLAACYLFAGDINERRNKVVA